MTDWGALIAVFIAVLVGGIFNNQRVGGLLAIQTGTR
jgi:hypothetical protein